MSLYKDTFYIKGGTIYIDEHTKMKNGALKIQNGKITEVSRDIGAFLTDDVIELEQNDIVLPGFIDIHIHGAFGADFMDGTEKAVEQIVNALPKEGTTSFLATTITSDTEHTARALEILGKYDDGNGAELLGIHLEGPFISKRYAGAQPVQHIKKPNIELFKKWQSISENNIKIVTLAPEVPGGQELLNFITSTGVIGSIGHSAASHPDFKEAVDNGLKHATHFFNGMKPMHHRDPGVVGSVFLERSVKTEVIFDRVHAIPEMVQLCYDILGSTRLILITDAMRGKGLTPGEYTLGGQKVTIKNSEARLEDGTLAGSVLTMDQAVRNMLKLNGVTWFDILRMTSLNAAESLGISNRKGRLKPGYDADITVLTSLGEVKYTFCRGQRKAD
ncbi:N-acetylglucosamine 6-phosphate deacetylase [Melghiribacillus thermohalophilus]|uniref:N-acetylglucosamine-6-phosphate deacetylase n=1 Tax=Melghiribacillus thermohalophilus TaxID=1324956 RepID=A0A4R3MPT8_9BACI|nr:N-acetylglucosamine-6-phosphate deacetylase [Melghiribacillus thermohalophilus]TCT17565.1 N-acetylglucosamine 6-phosphate deacetylase [Melghiribacillus thermohalophilus]